MKYRPKSVLTDATQWLQAGDHPEVQTLPDPDITEYQVPENPYCPHCGNLTARHGLLDGVNGEEVICPSDYIVHNRQGLPYRLNRGEFESQFEPYIRPPAHAPVALSDIETRNSDIETQKQRRQKP